MRTAASLAALACVLSCAPAEPDRAQLRAYADARALFEAGRLSDAADALSKAGEGGAARLLRGKVAFCRGEAETAETELRLALRGRPSSVEARIWLARSLRAQGREAEAAEIARDVLADSPGESRALRLASAAEAQAGNDGAARLYLDRAEEALSEDALALLDRARLFYAGGDDEAALADLRRAALLLPERSAARRSAEALTRTLQTARRAGAPK